MSVSSSNTLLADHSSTCRKNPQGVTERMVVAEEQPQGVYLTPSGLHIEHVGGVMLQGDDLGKAHVLVEELRAKEDSIVH